MRDMKNTKPLVRKAMKEAFKGLKIEIESLRKGTPNQLYWDRETWISSGGDRLGNGVDRFVVPLSYLDSKEVRGLNAELGLDTNEGINKWYA